MACLDTCSLEPDAERALFRFVLRLLVLFALAMCVTEASAQDTYPSKPIKLVIPYPPGQADALARVIGERLSGILGQPVLVDNRPGAGGNIASRLVASAAPDGYTLLVTGNHHNLNPRIYKDAGYDSRRSFVPVIQLTEGPAVLLTQPGSPFKSLQDLVQAAKARPGQIAYASAGIGSSVHIVTELFMASAQIELLHVPYKGSGPAIQDALGGRVPLVMASLGGALPFLKSGQLRALVNTANARWPALPDVPTFAELGYPEATLVLWMGIMAPAGTPAPRVDRLNREIHSILSEPAVRSRIFELALVPVGGPPEHFAKMLQADYNAVEGIVARTGMAAE